MPLAWLEPGCPQAGSAGCPGPQAGSGGCGGLGGQQGMDESEWAGRGTAERSRRGALCNELAPLTAMCFSQARGKTQPRFLSFIHLAVVSSLAVLYKLNKLKTVWKRSPLNLACRKTNRRGGRQGHAHPTMELKHPYLSSLSCSKFYLLQDVLK